MQANFFDFNKNKDNDSTSTTAQPETNNVEPETIYANEVPKVSSGRKVAAEENSVQNGENKSKAGLSDDEPGAKPEKKGRRRGVWKRVRVRPVDSFETAESQNIGKQLYNTLISDNVKEFGERNTKKPMTGTRIMSSPSAYAYEEMIHFNDDEPEVQTILPIQTTESTKSDDFDMTTLSSDDFSDLTTQSIEKDERELEATSTVDYSESDDLTTTTLPFIASDASSDLEKSTERPNTSSSTADEKSAKSNVSDQITEPSSIMDEVKQKLTELFSFEDDDVVVSTSYN